MSLHHWYILMAIFFPMEISAIAAVWDLLVAHEYIMYTILFSGHLTAAKQIIIVANHIAYYYLHINHFTVS